MPFFKKAMPVLITICCSFLMQCLESKILIFTYSYNRPDFIEIQEKTFKKFLKDDYEFVVFNDARDPQLYKQIVTTCEKLNLRCIPIPQEIHSKPYLKRWPGEDYNAPAVRNCNVVMYSLNNYGFDHDDIVVLLDSDLFLVSDFSIREFMKGYDLAGLSQPRDHDIKYLWIGIVFLDMRTLPNSYTIDFNCGKIDGIAVDAGGQTNNYLKKNPQLRVRYFDEKHTDSYWLMCKPCQKSFDQQRLTCFNPMFNCPHNTASLKATGFNETLIHFIEQGPHWFEYFENAFIHYQGGTNWFNKTNEFHKTKSEQLHCFIDSITQQ